MTTPPPLPETLRLARRRRAKAAGGVVAALGGALLASFAYLALKPDRTPVDEAGLLPRWSEGLEDNPLARHEAWAEARSVELSAEERAALRYSLDWDRSAVDTLLEERQETLRRFAALASAAREPWQWRGGSEVARLDGDALAPLRLREAALLERARGIRLAEQGRAGEALDSAERLLLAGAAMQGAEGTVERHFAGVSILSLGLDALARLDEVPGWTWDAGRARATLEILQEAEPRIEDLRFAFQAEFLVFQRILEDLPSGKARLPGGSELERRVAGKVVKPGDSAAVWQELLQPVADSLDRGWPEIEKAAADLEAGKAALRGSMPRLLASGNPVGRLVVSIALPDASQLAERHFETVAKVRAAWVRLAIRLFEAEAGRLPLGPGDLAELLPAGLPRDPFTGGPMIWDKEKRVVYSTGADLADHGGLVQERDRARNRDVGVVY